MNLRWALALGRPAAGRFVVAWLAGAAALASGVGLMATSAYLISRAAQHPPVLYLMTAIVAVRFFGIARGVFRYGERLLAHDAALRSLGEVRVRVYERLERLAPSGLPAFRSGDLLSRVVADVDTLQYLFLRVLLPYATAALVGAGAVALVAWLLPAAGLLLLGALLCAGVAGPWLSARLARRAEARVAPLRGELSAATVDLLRSAPELVAYGCADDALDRLADVDRRLTRSAATAATTSGLGAGLAALAGGAAVWGGLALGVPAVRGGSLDGVALAVVVLTPLAAFEVVAGLPVAAQQLTRVRRAAARIRAVLDRPDPVADPVAPAAVPDPPYTLRVEGLRVRWTAGAPLALDGVALTLAPGRRVAVVGASGSGKTTLASAMLRFVDAEGGRVTLNGLDTRALAGDDVRRVVGLCAQDAHVFDSTLEENVRLARRDASDDDLRAALGRARLLDFVDSLPLGLQTSVGEHGARLSGGQRQRLALARALLADFPVLVLDEPAEHLDLATADALTRDLLAATEGRTTLLVTHRLAGLEQVDEVVVLDRGRVVQRGTHADLVTRPGPYRRAWELEQDAAVPGPAVTALAS